MSLKAFHVVFITPAGALAFGFGVWELREYWVGEGRTANLIMGIASFATVIALILYERYFLKKTKDTSYL